MNFVKKISLALLFLASFQTAHANWVKQESKTLSWFHDIYFVNENKGFIAGSGGTLLITIDGGKTWKKEQNFTADTIRQIYFSDAKTGWLLCERNIFNLGTNSPSYLLKTTDGGANWEQINFGEGRNRIAKIFFTQNGFGLAVGESGTLFALQDDAKTWKKNLSPIRYLMLDGTFTDNFHGSMVGGGGTILFTEDAGASWNQATVFGNEPAKLNAVYFVNQKTGWTAGTNGKIYQTINGGKTWREQTSNTSNNLTDIFFKNTAEGWSVGDDGTILHTTTAGNVWTLESSSVKHKLEKVVFVGKKGFAVGFGGTILVYDESTKNNPNIKPTFNSRIN